jgi:hypothetical protein
MLRYLPLIILFGITIYALVECAQTDQEQVRNLPKWGWILIIILFGPQTLALGPIGLVGVSDQSERSCRPTTTLTS